jgi:LysR family hydrogen peroxide-inducible transcriptional activator
MLTLRQLSYLNALARHQHFGRAAEECGVSEPALSMQIRELERFLGVELVERRPGVAILTGLGVEIARRAESIVSATTDLVDLAHHGSRILTGTLCLGIIPTLAPYILPNVLPCLGRKHPDLCLELVERRTNALLEELRRGTLDVVLLALPIDRPEFATIRVFNDRFLLAVPAEDPWPENARVTARDVNQRKLLLLEEGHCLRDQALAFCAEARSNASTGLSATSLATIIQMVANGYGVTLVPEVAIDVEVRDERMKLLRFVKPEPNRTIGLAWRQTSPRKADFVALGQVIVEALNVPVRRRAPEMVRLGSQPVQGYAGHPTASSSARKRDCNYRTSRPPPPATG